MRERGGRAGKRNHPTHPGGREAALVEARPATLQLPKISKLSTSVEALQPQLERRDSKSKGSPCGGGKDIVQARINFQVAKGSHQPRCRLHRVNHAMGVSMGGEALRIYKVCVRLKQERHRPSKARLRHHRATQGGAAELKARSHSTHAGTSVQTQPERRGQSTQLRPLPPRAHDRGGGPPSRRRPPWAGGQRRENRSRSAAPSSPTWTARRH